MIEKHIIIESKNKNKNFPSDIKKNNSLSSNRINYNSNNDNINNLVAILDRNKYNFNSRMNLQLKPKENNRINISNIRHCNNSNIYRSFYAT